MRRLTFLAAAAAVATVGLGGLAAPAAHAQGADPELFAAGEALFATNCAFCHQADGTGNEPNFPALAGNTNLADVGLIVGNVHEGQGNMPPFPDFGAEDIAALASYVRNAWGNDYGPVAVDDVAQRLADIDSGGETRTIWDGVYTEAQAERGREAYGVPCGLCHGRRLNGAADDPDQPSGPPLARAPFLRNWDGRSLATLYQYARSSMPQSNPGFLSEQEYVDMIAYMLATSNAPAGNTELPPDPQALAHVIITQEP